MKDAFMIAAMDVASLEHDGFAVVSDFLASDAACVLRTHALARDAEGAFRRAGVGRGDSTAERPDIRSDRILWLDDASPAVAERPLLAALASLRERINAALYLGLWDYEAHYAIYPPGAFYARHRDRFADDSPDNASRIVSFVIYLNEGWRSEDGGALRLHLGASAYRDVLPESGTLACFLAERFEHEVLPATRQRLAVTGWFRTRGV